MKQKFDKQGLRDLRMVLERQLEIVGKSRGITLKVGNCSFTDRTATFKLEIGAVDDNGMAYTKDRERLEQFWKDAGLTKDAAGRIFAHKGSVYTIVGLSSKFKVVAEHAGHQYAFSADYVAGLLRLPVEVR